MANYKFIEINRGEDFTITDTVDAALGSIAGWAVFTELLGAYTDAAALVTKSVGSGIVLTTAGPPGVITTTFVGGTGGDTDQTPGSYNFTTYRKDAGARTQLTYGVLVVLPPRVR